MKAFILAVVAVAAVALASAWALSTQQQSSASAFSTESVRLGDPGRNLILEPVSPRARERQAEKTARD